MASSTTETTFDGSVIPAVIDSTAHVWTADDSGLYITTAGLASEWKANEAAMLAGHGDSLSAVARLEGNAEVVLDNTAAAQLPAAKLDQLRQDLQREFDAIGAAMTINQTRYGIDPTKPFNTYSYLKMQETLQGDASLKELAYQGHGVNNPLQSRYAGFTTDFRDQVDNSTYFVGGGQGNGTLAIPVFLEGGILGHAAFSTVMHNGVATQLNQNGTLENSTADSVIRANATMFGQVLVSSDFSTDRNAAGKVVLVPNQAVAPEAPVVPGPGYIRALDGTIIAGRITTTAHQWVADSTGLFVTSSDLAAEWKANYAIMQAGNAGSLTVIQRLEGNAEAVIDNTQASKLSTVAQSALRQDLQREFDAIDSGMRLDGQTFGIDPKAAFTETSYQRLQQTIEGNAVLRELAVQGHGLNDPASARYNGFTTDFQHQTDNSTLYVGGGLDNGQGAISDFMDDVILSHASFDTVMHNGTLEVLNQNGTLETTLTNAVTAANEAAFNRVFTASDFGAAATLAPPVAQPYDDKSATDLSLDPAYYAAHDPSLASGADAAADYHTVGWKAGLNPNAWFDTNYYLTVNPDVRYAGIDPLWHYENWGWREGRDPSLLFSDAKYLAANPDVAASGTDPLLQYVQHGQAQGRATYLSGDAITSSPLVQAAYYDKQLGATLIPAGPGAEQQAAASYDGIGWRELLNPNPWFNTAYYIRQNPEVIASGMDPLLHYDLYGWKEGLDPSAQFSTNKYLAAYSDVKASGMDPLLHFVSTGEAQGRTAFSVS